MTLAGTSVESLRTLSHAVGIVGAALFYGRFYVQWIVSEVRRRSVVPAVFWYMSSIGSVLLMQWAIVDRSPLGALSQCFNLTIYARNIVHIWRERGRLSAMKNLALHGAVVLVTLISVGFTAYIWLREIEHPKVSENSHAGHTWFWLGIGALGQVFFSARFIVQWLATERQRRSVIPKAFWYFSVVASLLQFSCFYQRGEWVFAAGMAATMFVYLRNIWLIWRHPERKVDAE